MRTAAAGIKMARANRLEYRNVTMRFADAAGDGLIAVAGVSLTVADGEVVSLIGPSGCGKSTLLNIGAGLYAPSEGAAFVDGEKVEGPNAHVAFMLQKDLLLPWRTVAANVMLGAEIHGQARAERQRRAQGLLDGFGLAEFAERYPHQLSGGMRQRAALARTLAVDPSVLLLDEPFSAVDAQTRMVLQRDLASTLTRAGKTALLITHVLMHTGITAGEVIAGFVLGSLLGAFIGYLLGMSPATEVAISPYILALQIAPKVAFAPLFILWMGYSVYPKILVAVLIVFFPVLVNVMTAVRGVDP